MRRFRITAYVTSILFAVGVALTGATAAQASEQAAATGYVALGDSYSSGVGAGSYDSSSGSCKRSTKAYPALWAAAHSPSSFSFTACSGARTVTFSPDSWARSAPAPASSRCRSAATTRASRTS